MLLLWPLDLKWQQQKMSLSADIIHIFEPTPENNELGCTYIPFHSFPGNFKTNLYTRLGL